jgi:probable F420-dependent oxidoreductase
MRFGVFAPLRNPVATPEVIAAFGRGCDEAGLDAIWLGEHVVWFAHYESRYPGSPDGVLRFPERAGLLDLVATIGFLAACTERVRLATGICLLPQRNPVYTAKEFACLDWLSKGRVDLGIGVGWSWEEYAACGVPWERRGARCDEYVEVLHTIWCDEVSSFSGQFYELPECLAWPKPVQEPHIPVHVGGHSDAALRRAARLGQGWFGFNLTPEDTAALLPRLERHLGEAGRARDDLEVTVSVPFGTELGPADLEAFAAVGVDQVVVPWFRQGEHHVRPFLDGAAPLAEAAHRLT